MTRFLLYAILLVFVIRALSRLMKGVLEGAGFSGATGVGKPSVNLVRDPVCGMFVVPTKALTSGSGDDTKYFCSEKCRREWGSSDSRGR
jgi:YHS domain-containing protein